MGVTGRFAPSPTGRMHLGNVAAALVSWLSARSQGGRWIVRVEDLDPARSRPEYAAAVLDDLEWLGLERDEADTPPMCQHDRTHIYAEALARLDTYPCYCSRAELLAAPVASAPHATDGHRVYAGTCRGLTDAERLERGCVKAPSLRLRVEPGLETFDDMNYGLQQADPARLWGDIIVRRADGVHAYQLAVVVDDAAQGVTEVVRGADLLSSTFVQLRLQRLLGLPAPRYGHIPLLRNAAGQRLSKRDAALDLGALRAGHTPAEVIGRVARLLGLRPDAAPVRPVDLLGTPVWPLPAPPAAL